MDSRSRGSRRLSMTMASVLVALGCSQAAHAETSVIDTIEVFEQCGSWGLVPMGGRCVHPSLIERPELLGRYGSGPGRNTRTELHARQIWLLQ
jgi:hypothetical protein